MLVCVGGGVERELAEKKNSSASLSFLMIFKKKCSAIGIQLYTFEQDVVTDFQALNICVPPKFIC